MPSLCIISQCINMHMLRLRLSHPLMVRGTGWFLPICLPGKQLSCSGLKCCPSAVIRLLVWATSRPWNQCRFFHLPGWFVSPTRTETMTPEGLAQKKHLVKCLPGNYTEADCQDPGGRVWEGQKESH